MNNSRPNYFMRLRSALLVAACALAACHSSTAPATVRGSFTMTLTAPGAAFAAGESAHVTFHHNDASVAADTTIALPTGATAATATVTVYLASGTGSTGEQLSLTIDFLAADHSLRLHSAPITVRVYPSSTTP